MLSLMKQKHLSPRQWRAMTYLSKFDLNFEFLPGKKNIIADPLSRIAERSTYQQDLPYLEEWDELDDSMLGAIQLRRGKILLEKPRIKTKSKHQAGNTPSQPATDSRQVEVTPSPPKPQLLAGLKPQQKSQQKKLFCALIYWLLTLFSVFFCSLALVCFKSK